MISDWKTNTNLQSKIAPRGHPGDNEHPRAGTRTQERTKRVEGEAPASFAGGGATRAPEIVESDEEATKLYE
jgi:hypothetical protein